MMTSDESWLALLMAFHGDPAGALSAIDNHATQLDRETPPRHRPPGTWFDRCRLVDDRPETTWAAACHSLGGVAASQAANDGIAGLVSWASFPASDISDRADLAVSSVDGTADAIAPRADELGSRDRLPPLTGLILVDGAIHSSFGDYGLQPADGKPTVDRREAQESIVTARFDLLRALDSGA